MVITESQKFSFAHAGDEPNLYLIFVTGCLSVGKINDTDIFRITATSCMSLQNNAREEEVVGELRKFLNSGSFYFSWSSSPASFDLSLCAQRYMSTTQITDNRFFWWDILHFVLLLLHRLCALTDIICILRLMHDVICNVYCGVSLCWVLPNNELLHDWQHILFES